MKTTNDMLRLEELKNKVNIDIDKVDIKYMKSDVIRVSVSW